MVSRYGDAVTTPQLASGKEAQVFAGVTLIGSAGVVVVKVRPVGSGVAAIDSIHHLYVLAAVAPPSILNVMFG